jgi:hypothetical protein
MIFAGFGDIKTSAGTCCPADENRQIQGEKSCSPAHSTNSISFFHVLSVLIHFVLNQTLTGCCREKEAINNHKPVQHL